MTLQLTTRLPWTDRPHAELFRIGWPMMVQLVSTSIINLVDTLFLGRLGSVPLAAAGLGGVCAFAVVSFGLALLGAAKVKVGEAHGRNDHTGVQRYLGTFVRLALVMGVASVVLGLLAGLFLPLLIADAETGTLAGEYLMVRSLGFLFFLLAAALGNWLQAQGQSAPSMRAALVANVLNVPLNALLLFGLEWGVMGAALATVTARLVELLWLAAARVKQGFNLQQSSWGEVWELFRLGFSTGVERVLDMVAFAAVPLLLALLAPTQVAAHQITLQMLMPSFLPLFALAEASSILVSQAAGARQNDLVPRLVWIGLGLALGYALLFGAVMLVGGELFVGFFTSERKLQEVTLQTLWVAVAAQFVNAAYNQIKGVLRGLSVFSFVAWVTVLCAWVFTPPLTYWLGVRHGMGAPGAWAAITLEVIVGTVLLALRLRARWREVAGVGVVWPQVARAGA